uniref:Wsv299-like protein n=1 Tax=Sesarmops intermedium nimavirus TaxID=2133796 RepID=A0A401IPP1_9VIRU|nr:MAG: wsv299-like protein [Sesarmops intermedium nimavirus]GBG35583.1 wsv299-like protein [Sesarmops intermedium nimavirus]
MDNIITNQNIFLAFASGVAVGCSVTIILGMLLKIVVKFVDCRKQLQRHHLSKKKVLYYICGGAKEKEEELDISDPILESTTFPIASVSTRHPSMTASKTPTECSERRLGKSTCRPLFGEEDVYSSPPTCKPRLYSSPPIGEPRLYTLKGVYSSPPIGEPRLYTLKDDSVYSSPPTGEPRLYTLKDDGVYSSPPTGEPRLYLNNNNTYLPMNKYSEGSTYVKSLACINIRATDEGEENHHYETIPALAATVAVPFSYPLPPPPVPDFPDHLRNSFTH